MDGKYALLLPLLGAVASAQQSLYGQCGGIGYSGSTACVASATCTSANDYYYQCVPATGVASKTTTTAVTTTAKTTSKASTTTKAPSTSKTTSVATSTGTAPSSSATQYFITFGDSYSQTGFNVTTGPLPDASNPLGNPPFPGYTTDNGNNWIDNLIAVYNKTLLLNYNFAYGGATTNSSLVAPYEVGVLSLVDQVTEFTDSIASKPSTAPWTSSDSLFGVWMGVNDVGNSWYESNVTDILNAIMTSYFDQMQILYDAGARNFLLLSVPPIQETPLMLASGATSDAEEAVVIEQYNDLLATNLASFEASNSGITAQLVNTTIPFQTAIDDPTAYGAANATCYDADGTTCLWWNNYHPGLAIQKLVAEEIAGGTFKGSFFT
ncbi:hypothetical protein F5Y16DRAFT_178744 [Xylariaceae sp. FL0255]|nr:hypothetical protein F5Y16DRAFT_178744 [Xylariaceae sp. FL0255]